MYPLKVPLLLLVLLVALCHGQSSVLPPIGPSDNPLPVSPTQLAKIQNLADEMYNRWSVLDQACDPRAVFAVAYLYMTANAAKLVNQGYFDDGNRMADYISLFAGRYISAFDTYAAGHHNAVSLPWKTYFDFLATNRSDVTEDITIGMDAHINYDLGIATYEMGYVNASRTADFYRVNDLMGQVDVNVTTALGRYDAQFYNTDFVSQTYFTGSVQFVTSWRTGAYTQAVSYQAAADATSIAGTLSGLLGGASRATVASLEAANEAAAGAVAASFAVPYPYNTAPSRIAYCMTQNSLPLPGNPSR